MKMTQEEIERAFRGPGKPKIYHFENMEVGDTQFIECKVSDRDRKLKTARSSCSYYSVEGKRFLAKAEETGILIVRQA